MTPARTGKGNTTPRSIRIPEDLWQAALAKAHADGTTLSAVVVGFLRQYVSGAHDRAPDK